MVREHLNPNVSIIGILPTMYDKRLTHSREADDILRENFGDLVFNTRIRKTIRYAEARVTGASVLAYEPEGEAAVYRDLAKEVLRGNGQDREGPLAEGLPRATEAAPARRAGDRAQRVTPGRGAARDRARGAAAGTDAAADASSPRQLPEPERPAARWLAAPRQPRSASSAAARARPTSP